MVATFEDVVDRVKTGWAECQDLIKDDIEAEDGFRR